MAVREEKEVFMTPSAGFNRTDLPLWRQSPLRLPSIWGVMAYFEMSPPNRALSSPLSRSDEEGRTLLPECGDGAVFLAVTQAGESPELIVWMQESSPLPPILLPSQTPNHRESTTLVILVTMGRQAKHCLAHF